MFVGWVGGRIYYQVYEQIKVLGPYAHQDIAAKLNNGRWIFRGELGVQLSWIKDVQGGMFHGVRNLAHNVDNRLIQNDQRNTTQEGVMSGLFAEMQKFGG